MRRSEKILLGICALALGGAIAWYFKARDLREFSRLYIESVETAKNQIGSEFRAEAASHLSRLPAVPSYFNIPGLLRVRGVKNNTRIGSEIDRSRTVNHGVTVVVSTIANDLIKKAENEIELTIIAISERAVDLPSGSADLTPFIREKLDELLVHWRRAELICLRADLDRTGVLCPTEADSRFSELAEIIALRGEPGLDLTPRQTSAELIYPYVFAAEFCNSTPYPVEFLRAGEPLGNDRTNLLDLTVQSGDCQTLFLGKSEPSVFVAARPKAGDPTLAQVESASGERSGFVLPESAAGVLSACFLEGSPSRISVEPANPRCARHVDLASLTFRPTGQVESHYPVMLSTFDVSDSWIAARTPEQVFRNHSLRRGYARDLNGALRNRQYWLENPDHVPWYYIGLTPCEGDDEFQPGVRICSILQDLPHGGDALVYPGETLLKVNDVSVFSVLDVWSVLTGFYRVSRIDKPIRVEVEGGYREGLLMFNPRAFSGCPYEAGDVFWSSFWRSLTITGNDFAACSGLEKREREACFSDRYEAALKRTQFCPDEDLAGTIFGSIGSLSGLAAKTVLKGLARGTVREAGLAALRSSIGIGAMAALEEYAYAYITEPPVSPNTPIIDRAAPSMAIGFVLAFITAR